MDSVVNILEIDCHSIACSFLWNPLYTSDANAALFSHVHFPGLNPPDLRGVYPSARGLWRVSVNNAFHEFPKSVLHCEDALSIQLVVVFPWFGNRS